MADMCLKNSGSHKWRRRSWRAPKQTSVVSNLQHEHREITASDICLARNIAVVTHKPFCTATYV